MDSTAQRDTDQTPTFSKTLELSLRMAAVAWRLSDGNAESLRMLVTNAYLEGTTQGYRETTEMLRASRNAGNPNAG